MTAAHRYAAKQPEPSALVAKAEELSAEFALTAAGYDRSGAFPFANFEALRAAGLLSLTVPEAAGGLGEGLATACNVVGRIAAGEPSTALVLAMHYIYCAVPAFTGSWDATATRQLWQDSVEGIALINVMRVEPDLGTPARGGMPMTTATPTERGWRISGHKLYATGSPILRYLVVWARTAPAGGNDEPRVGWFLVPNGAPGVSYVETWDHLGMRATGSHDLILDGVEIPGHFALDVRPPAAWMPPDPVQPVWNNLVLAALYNGIAGAARDWLSRYLHERKPSNLGASLATLPRFQAAVGEIEALLFTNARLLTSLAAEADGAGYTQQLAGQTSLAKYVVTTNAIRAVDVALALVGNPGLSRANPLERHHRDVLCGRIHVPQDDMILLGAGRAALHIS